MSNPAITTQTTVGEIVRARPDTSRVFERLGIDYCCGGKKTIAEACQPKRLDAPTVVALLQAIDAAPANAADVNADAMTLSALCDHIQKVHHEYLRQELPRLDFMTRKVAAVHGEHEPRLLQVREVFQHFALAMAAHTVEEEQQIFPKIRRLDATHGDPTTAAAELKRDLHKLESEHDRAGAALEKFNQLTDGYTPPEWACNTFRALYDGLAKLEAETHQHVHKENNVLFPRALAAVAA